MMIPRAGSLTATALLLAVGVSRAEAQAHFPGDDSVRAIVRRVATLPPGVSVVVGLLDRDGTRRVIAVGDTSLNGRSLFEIGSITKVFTGILLAYAVETGEARLDQPVQELLPDSVRVPTREGKQITLLNLATHTSGLPRMPNNFRPADVRNPYADYTIAQLYQFLEGHTLERDIGDENVYSNYGAGLLGHVLARRAGTTWEQLVRTRILDPLGMRNTMIVIPDSARARLVQGHDGSGRPVSNWDLAESFVGAGGLRSGADDMLTFIAANMAPDSSMLGRALRRATARYAVGFATGGLHWGVTTNRFGNTTIGHSGGTAGYATSIAYDPARRIGVVVLHNASGVMDPSRIGRHLLDQRLAADGTGRPRDAGAYRALSPPATGRSDALESVS